MPLLAIYKGGVPLAAIYKGGVPLVATSNFFIRGGCLWRPPKIFIVFLFLRMAIGCVLSEEIVKISVLDLALSAKLVKICVFISAMSAKHLKI